MNEDRSTAMFALGLLVAILVTLAVSALLSVPFIDNTPHAPTTTATVPLAPLP